MEIKKEEWSFSTIRREYGLRGLSEKDILSDPMAQFKRWFEEVMAEEMEPTAMSLATVDEQGLPNVRIVLLKGIEEEGFIFYTHYDSAKGQEIALNPKVALNFFWVKSVRQVRIRGTIKKVPSEISDDYFASRPILSQVSAVASHQSQVLNDRDELESAVARLEKAYADKAIPRPREWGGYIVNPDEMEFWQGRDNRLHDRIRYRREKGQWIKERLAP